MNEDSDFFGEVFENPDDDPLLGDDEDAPNDPDARPSSTPGPPSWASEEREEAREDGCASGDAGPSRKNILLDQRNGATTGLNRLNKAIGEGWKLVRISLTQPNGEQAATPRDARRFVVTIEQDSPRSLFDFGTVS